ncbi:MAG: tRNA pseudouridine(55) synthase TruB [Deltaproteobacteria bacterium]|nr:tRNA pseudouridine(55) synthase TruB [Deltaproteobacteria bacterium]
MTTGARGPHGVLVVDKPAGISSAQAVETVKRALGASRAGHGGTLDPLATGVLPVCLGAATKLAQHLLADDKAYEADAVLGVETDTLDRTGRVVRERPWQAATREALERALAARTGEHDQVPPMYSAIKQGGVRLYQRARAGEEVERAPRRVRIDRLELLAWEPPHFRIAIACGKGTYVRSLVADLGEDLGCGAHLTELRRTQSGRFSLAQAVPLDALDTRRMVAPSDALGLPVVRATAELLRPILSGVQLALEALEAQDLEQFQILAPSNQLLAIAHAERGRVIYDRVFPELAG